MARPVALSDPLLMSSPGGQQRRTQVQVYSVYGKETVETDTTCLSGTLACFKGIGAADSGENPEVMRVIWSSVWINLFLFFGKLYAFLASGSLAVLASLVDSTIDLLGQGVLIWTKQLSMGKRVDDYPVGKGKLEPVGVMICAVVMGMASIEVISTSVGKLVQYWGRPDPPSVDLTASTVFILVGVVVLKAILYVWCSRVGKRNNDDESVKAIAQDNWNDAISNFVVLLATEATHLRHDLWFIDPGAAIVISIYIIYAWLCTGYEQVEMIVGKRADPDFLRSIQNMAEQHDSRMQLDTLCAYHFGAKYLVEIEVVMHESTQLRDSHDAGIKLQHKIETLEDVERCFVHIDYQLREHDDHDPTVDVAEKVYGGTPQIAPRLPKLDEAPSSP